jgi:hypothetical protein
MNLIAAKKIYKYQKLARCAPLYSLPKQPFDIHFRQDPQHDQIHSHRFISLGYQKPLAWPALIHIRRTSRIKVRFDIERDSDMRSIVRVMITRVSTSSQSGATGRGEVKL